MSAILFYHGFEERPGMALLEGLAACAFSSLLFGSMFIPVKKFDAGNGERIPCRLSPQVSSCNGS